MSECDIIFISEDRAESDGRRGRSGVHDALYEDLGGRAGRVGRPARNFRRSGQQQPSDTEHRKEASAVWRVYEFIYFVYFLCKHHMLTLLRYNESVLDGL